MHNVTVKTSGPIKKRCDIQEPDVNVISCRRRLRNIICSGLPAFLCPNTAEL